MNSIVQWLEVSGCDFPPKKMCSGTEDVMNDEFRRMWNKEDVIRIRYCPVCRQTEGNR